MKSVSPSFYDENAHWFRFIIQIGLMAFIAIEQIQHMKINTGGISIAMFFSAGCYAAINFLIALGSRKDFKSEAIRQTFVYVSLMLMHFSICSFAVAYKSSWDDLDYFIVSLVTLSIFVSYYLKCKYNLNWNDSFIKGLFALSFRILPQTFLAAKIIYTGGSGYSVSLIVAFHIMKCMRIYEIRHLVKKHHSVSFRRMIRNFSSIKKEVRSQFTLFICEVSTEITWILVTLAWFLTR